MTELTAQMTVTNTLGTNLRREDPIQYVNCVGFVREYHDWVVDEGDVFGTDLRPGLGEDCFNGEDDDGDGLVDCEDPECDCASEAYPNNRFRWNPG